MPKVLVLYYSSYGHMEQMANAAAEGARQTGAEAVVKRVPELVPEEVARNARFKLDQPAPIATVDELPGYDAISSAFRPATDACRRRLPTSSTRPAGYGRAAPFTARWAR